MAAVNRSWFVEADFEPSTGLPHVRLDAGKRTELGRRNAEIISIFVSNPEHLPVLNALDELLAVGSAQKEAGLRQYALRITGPSGAGKSTVCDHFARVVAARGSIGSEEMPVVRVELEQACTPKRMWAAVLGKFGDEFIGSGDEEQLRRRAYKALQRARTRLLILDETQHLFYKSKGGSVPTDCIKRFLDDGVVPVALAGNEDARLLLESNVQLVNRMMPPADIRALDPASAGDRSSFAGWVVRFDKAIQAKGLFDRTSGLDDPRIVAALMEVSGGILGRAANLVRAAAFIAYGRDAAFIELCDLSNATVRWAVAQGVVAADPFRHGCRKPSRG